MIFYFAKLYIGGIGPVTSSMQYQQFHMHLYSLFFVCFGVLVLVFILFCYRTFLITGEAEEL